MFAVNNELSQSDPSASNNRHTPTTFNLIAPTNFAVPSSKLKKSKRKDKDRANLTTKDIGIPVNFRHILHVEGNPIEGFESNIEDKDLRTFLDKAGVSAGHLNDEFTRKFIYDFIEQHGVVDLVKRFANNANTNITDVPPFLSTSRDGPPPVPARTSSIRNSISDDSTKHPGPSAPPSIPVPPPLPIQTHPCSLPKMDGAMCRPKSLPPVSVTNDRSQLMNQIQQGKQLKKADILPMRVGRISDCLNEIQRGVNLKHIPERVKKPPPSIEEMDGLVGALARALAARHKAIKDSSSDSSENEDECNKCEWD